MRYQTACQNVVPKEVEGRLIDLSLLVDAVIIASINLDATCNKLKAIQTQCKFNAMHYYVVC